MKISVHGNNSLSGDLQLPERQISIYGGLKIELSRLDSYSILITHREKQNSFRFSGFVMRCPEENSDLEFFPRRMQEFTLSWINSINEDAFVQNSYYLPKTSFYKSFRNKKSTLNYLLNDTFDRLYYYFQLFKRNYKDSFNRSLIKYLYNKTYSCVNALDKFSKKVHKLFVDQFVKVIAFTNCKFFKTANYFGSTYWRLEWEVISVNWLSNFLDNSRLNSRSAIILTQLGYE